MNPPPPMLPARGSVTASANPTATAASTALPPLRRISTPTLVASGSSLTTMPLLASTGASECAAGAASAAARKPMTAIRKKRRNIGLLAADAIVFGVGLHVGGARHAVRHGEEAGHRGDVPDVAGGEAAATQRRAVGFLDCPRLDRELPGEVEHGAGAQIELGGAVVGDDGVAEFGVARKLAHRRAVGDEAIVAVVGARHDDGDHLALELGEAGL